MQTTLAKRYVLLLAGVSILLLAFRSASVRVVARADSPKPVSLAIHRQHAGTDCTSGQMVLDGQVVAYTLERPWEGNIPLISSIPSGHYHGFVRTRTKDRWRIELIDVPNRPNIQLHVGNFAADGVGCILIGSNLKPDLCTLTDSKAAFDKFKLAFAAAAAKLGQTDVDTPVELAIGD
jgi:hypothetical protein